MYSRRSCHSGASRHPQHPLQRFSAVYVVRSEVPSLSSFLRWVNGGEVRLASLKRWRSRAWQPPMPRENWPDYRLILAHPVACAYECELKAKFCEILRKSFTVTRYRRDTKCNTICAHSIVVSLPSDFAISHVNTPFYIFRFATL